MVAKNRRRNPSQVRQPRASFYAWKLEETGKILEALRKKSDAGAPTVVEGRRDEQALRKLGVTGSVLCLKAAGETRIRFLEKLDGFRDVVLLPDFDREGGELRSWLYQELSRRGIRADDILWRRLRSLTRKEVRSVEEFPSFIRSVEARARGERP